MVRRSKEMKTLVIDNIDSFVYNLVQYVGILGGNPTVLQNNSRMEDVRCVIEKEGISHIIISPGPKRPEDAGISNSIIKEFGQKIPLLGVCLGHQCIAHVFGGKIRRANVLMHGKTSKIEHNEKGILKGIQNPLIATRYHSLVVDEDSLPDCLEITAKSQDDGEIMALKHKEFPIFGLQFHPESILTDEGMKIMRNFLEVRG